MLCPEIWKFDVPHSSLKIKKSSEKFSKKEDHNNFYYNHLVSVIIPDSLRFPDNLSEKLVNDCEYYKVLDLYLNDLLNEDFLISFVRSGLLTLLSINTRIDCDNCVGITPAGQIVLNVDKQTYQQLGLEGQLSHFSAKTKNRYIITINLKEISLESKKSKFRRIKSRLQTLGKFTVIFFWEPPEKQICPSSIAKYFFDLGYDTKVCSPKFFSNTVYSVKVPEININDINENEAIEFAEWLGMISINGSLEENDPENYVTNYATPEPNIQLGQVKHLQWRGLFSVHKIEELIDEIIKYNQIEYKPWISIYVQGFSDSPVAWGMEEHHYYTNGDNGYLIIFSKEKYLFCTQRCSRKRLKNF